MRLKWVIVLLTLLEQEDNAAASWSPPRRLQRSAILLSGIPFGEAAAHHSAVLCVALLTHTSLQSQRRCPHFTDGESDLDTVPRITT